MNLTTFFSLVIGCEPQLNPCFVGTTQIWTERGMTTISQISIGDKVWSYNTKLGRCVLRSVTDCLMAKATTLFTLSTTHSLIEGVTAEHPFFNPLTQRWIEAKNVRVGDMVLVNQDGRIMQEAVENIQSFPSAPVTVYNLTVEEPEHNYFANGILVHNKSIVNSAPIVTITSPEDEAMLSSGPFLFTGLVNDTNEDVMELYIRWYFDEYTLEECEGNLSMSGEVGEVYCEVDLQEYDRRIWLEALDGFGDVGFDEVTFTVSPLEDASE